MNIEVNTDNTINGDEKHQAKFIAQIEKELHNYKSHLTQIDVHLSDQNGNKKGWGDILCLLKAQIDGRDSIVVSDQANTIESAMSGAIDKLKASLERILGQLHNHH